MSAKPQEVFEHAVGLEGPAREKFVNTACGADESRLERRRNPMSTQSTILPKPAAAPLATDQNVSKRPDPGPLAAAHSPNFPALLRQLKASLLVTTYQAGRLVMVRDEGSHLNTHYRCFQAPMGLALANGGSRLAIGTSTQVWDFRDVPSVAHRLESGPGGLKHDACFLPRSNHYTGNVQIHEMDFDSGGQLWFVNTRFSCLCTLDPESSFVPRWRPRFITELEPSDRCHLNGLAMVNGKPKYVTALGESNEAAGWRANKARGGILMDVESGEIICRGLSMPHSPRWHNGKLWVCESGSGTLGTIDLSTGRYQPVAEAPGFTRGLDFVGDLAFVGLSQVRESAVFSGIPITERLAPEQRTCGVCVVDLRAGKPVALLKFTSGVQEVFAVAALSRRFPDLINEDEKGGLLESSFVVPTECLKEVAATVRSGGGVAPKSV
jgi:uncharacterized protein (TIGR03032 family)